MNKNVLIVGAGPVGLAAAVALSRAGVSFRVIDRLPAPINQSRAAIVHARTLEHFERLDLVEDFLSEGVRVHGAVIYGVDGRILVRPSLDYLPTPYPYMLGLEQFKTEAILAARLDKAGIEVERGVELLDFQDKGESVSVHLRHPDGSETTEDFAYLIGTDGARSTVRAGLGLKLEGETLDQTWLTVDVKIPWDRDPGEAISYLAKDGIVFIAAMNDDRWRVIVNHGHLTPEDAEKATVKDVETIVRERFNLDVEFYDCVWISAFGINTRMASTMNRGRVFLAGDASHVHSPVGGQGMNTGIQDALNLAWKLNLVLKGLAKPALLDSYNAERHANARRLLQRIGAATKMASIRQPVAIEVRNHVIRLLGHLGIGHVMPGFLSMLDVGYPESPAVAEVHLGWFSGGPHAGARAPYAQELLMHGASEPQDLYHLWKGDDRHQLLVFGLEHPYPESSLYRITRIVREGTPSEGVAVDAEGHVHETYAAREGACYLIRPDGIIAFRSGEPDPAALAAYLEKWYVKD